MQTIEAKFEILECPWRSCVSIARAARTCYKSKGKITSESAELLTQNLISNGHEAMVEFGGWIVVKFYSNRGFTHELVRHRLASFAQESTRYCNYSKGKFGGHTTYIDPTFVLEMKVKDPEKRAEFKAKMLESWARSEADYMDLVSSGCPAELAREVLAIGLKAEIVIGATVREWRHIFELRTSKKAHPRMRELMRPLLTELRRSMPVVFDDVGAVED